MLHSLVVGVQLVIEDPKQLLSLLSARNDDAARQVFDRYVNRLIGLARNRLSARMSRRVDPEDVVQSAFRSFFRKAGDSAFELEETGDLWRLLVVITLNKLHRRVEHHQAAKRNMSREVHAAQEEDGPTVDFVSGVDEPIAAVELEDELAHITSDFSAQQQQMVELRLQGYQLQEIADEVGMSERTVRRTIKQLSNLLQSRLSEIDSDASS